MRLRVPPKNKRLPHLWFAWHPVKVHLTWVWLETVRRRRTPDGWSYILPEHRWNTN